MGFYRLKAQHNGTEYPWPCDREPRRTLQIFADDILTMAPADAPPPMEPGTMTKHTGLGCFGIQIPREHLDEYSGWPRMSLNGHRYGQYEEPRLLSSNEGEVSK